MSRRNTIELKESSGRTIRRDVPDVPTADPLTKAWMTVKTLYDDLDAAAIFQKGITTTNQAGVGHIEKDGSTDGKGLLRFDISVANADAVEGEVRFYDIKVLMAGFGPVVIETGTILAARTTTDAVA